MGWRFSKNSIEIEPNIGQLFPIINIPSLLAINIKPSTKPDWNCQKNYLQNDYVVINNQNYSYFHKLSDFLQSAAEKGNHNALLYLGHYYCNGKVIQQDYSKAMECFINSSKEGNIDWLVNIGLLYAKGKGVEQNYSKALEYYQSAA